MEQALVFALEHEERVKMGRRLLNDNDLTPLQWAAVQGLVRGRNRYEEERERQQPPAPR